MICSNCSAVQEDTNAFCESCGSQLARTCPSCSRLLSGGDRFCQGCGAPAAAPPSDRRAWTPPAAGYPRPGPGYPPPAGPGSASLGFGYPPGAGIPPFPPPGLAWGDPAGFGPTADSPLADWGSRAGAYLLDVVAILVPFLVVGIGLGRVSAFFAFIAYLFAIASGIWFAVQVGSTGQSPGMRVVGLRCISTRTGLPIGGAMGFVRALCHSLCGLLCGIGTLLDLLFPLWDRQKQTLADKMVSSVVVRVPKQRFSLAPRR